jgi:hypothetical protein
VVKAGSWDVSYNRNGTSGDPPVDLGDHDRRYQLTPDCASIDDCRIRARTFSSGGAFVGNIVFTWRGGAYEYRGSANYYRQDGGTTCTTSGGDTVANAYNVRELVRLEPDRYVGGEVVELTGTKTITGTPTAAGSAAGCQPYELTYRANLST